MGSDPRIRGAQLKDHGVILLSLTNGRSASLRIQELPASTGPTAIDVAILAEGDLLSVKSVTGDFLVTAHELDSIAGDAPMSRVDLAVKIGHTLRLLRRERGLSLSDLETLTGIATPNLSKLESGLVAPRIETLAILGKALNVPLADIVAAVETGNPLRRLLRSIRRASTLEGDTDAAEVGMGASRG